MSKESVRQNTLKTIQALKKVLKKLDEIENLIDDSEAKFKKFKSSPSSSRAKTGISFRLAKELGLVASISKLKTSVRKPFEKSIPELEKVLTEYRLK